MAGYDGHRGWIYSLAVMPEYRRAGIGSRLLDHAESRLIALGCVKIKLQFLETNSQVMSFYERHGYEVDPVISMGKQIYRG
jgi:ribosomal protein S18 acetylase RimI-like enzyme